MIMSAALGFFPKGLKIEFETAVVNEPSVFEPLKFYCTCTLNNSYSAQPHTLNSLSNLRIYSVHQMMFLYSREGERFNTVEYAVTLGFKSFCT